jgi:hypothetical protein
MKARHFPRSGRQFNPKNHRGCKNQAGLLSVKSLAATVVKKPAFSEYPLVFTLLCRSLSTSHGEKTPHFS